MVFKDTFFSINIIYLLYKLIAWLSGILYVDGSFYLKRLYDKSSNATSFQYYLRLFQIKLILLIQIIIQISFL